MRSASTAVARRAKRAQPTHNISDSHIPDLRILSILCQHFVAFNHRDQEACSLFRNQVAADCSLILPPPQSHGDAFLPAMEDSLQSLTELFVEQRHFLRQIDQWTALPYVSWPSWYRLYNADQCIDRVFVLAPLQRKGPSVTGNTCNDLFDNGIPQSFLAFEMVVERSLRDVGGGQNCIYSGTLEAVSVNFAKTRLQQAFPRPLRIAQPHRSTFWILAYHRHTNQYVRWLSRCQEKDHHPGFCRHLSQNSRFW
jgi:hypothetical protein